MSLKAIAQVSKSLRIGLLIAGATGLAIGGMAWLQVQRERRIDLEDADRPAHVLVHPLSDDVHAALARPDEEGGAALRSQLDGYRRLIGFAVYRPAGGVVAAGQGGHQIP